LAPGDSVCLTLRYAGGLDGRVCYLDVDQASYYNTRRGEPFFHLGRRHVLLERDALVLIPEVMWYPMAIPPVHAASPALSGREYTSYRLRVVQPVQPVVVSQGEESRMGDTVQFLPPRPLEGISLCGAKYERATVNLQGIVVDLYYFKGSDFISPVVQDSVRDKFLNLLGLMFANKMQYSSIFMTPRDVAQMYYKEVLPKLKCRDWFNGAGSHFVVVETPLPFTSHARVWKKRSEFVQPGMLLVGERGMNLGMRYCYTYFNDNSSFWGEQGMPGQHYVSFAQGLSDVLFRGKNVVDGEKNPFLKQLKFYDSFAKKTEVLNPYDCSSTLFEPTVTFSSSCYGNIDQILKGLMTDFRGNTVMHNENLESYLYLQKYTLEEAFRDKKLSPYLLDRIISWKVKELQRRIQMRVPLKKVKVLLDSLLATSYGEVPLDTFSSLFQTKFGVDFEEILKDWDTNNITTYKTKNLKMERIEIDGRHRGFIMRFQVQNVGDYPGIITYAFLEGELNHLVLQPGECKQVAFRGYANSATVSLGLSRNIPSEFSFSFEQYDNITQKMNNKTTSDSVCGVWNIPIAQFVGQEIVVDNEDPGFRLEIPNDDKLLSRLSKEVQYDDRFGGLPPTIKRWKRTFLHNVYGETYKTAYVKMDGEGKFKAEWSAEIPEDGKYEIFVFVPRSYVFGRLEQYYTVSGNGVEAEEILMPLELDDWTSLGQFDLKKGKSLVVLDDRVPSDKKDKKKYIVADAVKWVKVK